MHPRPDAIFLGVVGPCCLCLQLLLFLQTQVAGELRSSLLDSLSAQSANATSSVTLSMSEDDIAAQLAAAIAAVRKREAAAAAAAASGLDDALAAGQLAAWVLKAAVGVGALQLVKAGAGVACEQVSHACFFIKCTGRSQLVHRCFLYKCARETCMLCH